MKSWAPRDAKHEFRYRAQAVTNCFSNGLSNREQFSEVSLCHLLEGTVNAALNVDYDCAAQLQRKGLARLAELKEVESQIRMAASMEDKRTLRRKAQLLRRRWKTSLALQTLGGLGKQSAPPPVLKCSGDWADELQRHCESKYCDDSMNAQRVQTLCDQLAHY